MRIDRKVKGLLKSAGAVLKRHRKHLVYELGNGETVVISGTPSDTNAYKNQMRAIKSKIPFETEPVKPKAIQEKRSKPGRHGEPRYRPAPPQNNALADQLRTIGITEAALREELAFAYSEAMRFQELMFKALEKSQDCWMCRLRDWWNDHCLPRWGRR